MSPGCSPAAAGLVWACQQQLTAACVGYARITWSLELVTGIGTEPAVNVGNIIGCKSWLQRLVGRAKQTSCVLNGKLGTMMAMHPKHTTGRANIMPSQLEHASALEALLTRATHLTSLHIRWHLTKPLL
jgi:hypothetical protein